MKRSLLAAIFAACSLSGCSSGGKGTEPAAQQPPPVTEVSVSPRTDIIGVWELTKMLEISGRDMGYVTNIKMIFRPDGKMDKLSPEEKAPAETTYDYTLESNGKLTMSRPPGAPKTASFFIRGNSLALRSEPDGAIMYLKKLSSDPSSVPVLQAVPVPCAPKESDPQITEDLAADLKEAYARLPAIQFKELDNIPAGRLLGFGEEAEGLMIFGTDGEAAYLSRLEDGIPREQAIKALTAALNRK